MLIPHLTPLAASLFSLLAIGSLLLSFVMLGSRWLRDYLFAFAAGVVDHRGPLGGRRVLRRLS